MHIRKVTQVKPMPAWNIEAVLDVIYQVLNVVTASIGVLQLLDQYKNPQ